METQKKIVDEERTKQGKTPIDIVFQDIHYSVEVEIDKDDFKLPCKRKYETKEILKGVTGIAKAGQVTAIMGASGAGKTTLLNIIACRIDHYQKDAPVGSAQGSLFANDLEYSFRDFGNFANYVMQNDVLLQSLTVRETLEYVAALRLKLGTQDRKEIVKKLVHDLKLEKCVDVVVGGDLLKGISGGEKKRTAIAFELISDPSVIMLDEPTSGLDSLTAFIICNYLRDLTRKENKTVLMTIHQPNSDIFKLFDKLILMVEGRMVYQGAAEQAVTYFDRMGFICPDFSNPPDYFMSILHHESTVNVGNYPKYFETYDKQLSLQVQNEITQKKLQQIPKRQDDVSFCQKLGAICKKDLLNIVRNPMVFRARIVQSIILGLFVGGVYWQMDDDEYIQTNPMTGESIAGSDFFTLTGFFFFLSIAGLMSALSPVAIVFPKERVVFLKEEGSRLYNTLTFFVSRNVVQLPFMVLIPLLWGVIMYWMVGLSSTAGQFFTFYLIFFLVGFAGNSLGLLIGSAVSDAKLVTVLIPISIIPFVLFSGFYKNREDLPVWLSWIEYISPMKYTFIAFVRNELDDVENDQQPVSFLNFESRLKLWPTIFILLGLSMGFRLLSLLFLYLGRKKLQ